jgi:hypothetical protein
MTRLAHAVSSCGVQATRTQFSAATPTAQVWDDAPAMAVVVISYARTDQQLVRAIVKLLRGAHFHVERAVFWDEDFDPGDVWFDQITKQIDGAPQLFVFWCEHSSRSAQVRREFLYAAERQKRIVPVLLDDTPLVEQLSHIHGIDLRHAVAHHGITAAPPVSPVPTRRTSVVDVLGTSAVVAGAISVMLSLLTRTGPATLAGSLLLLIGAAGWNYLRRRRVSGSGLLARGETSVPAAALIENSQSSEWIVGQFAFHLAPEASGSRQADLE